MTALTTNRAHVRKPAARICFAAGLVLVLAACAPNYRATCIDAGKLAGSPELTSCVQGQIDAARADRTRHLKYSRGR